MKLFHLADLHIGKKVNGFSMLDDQKYILKKIINAYDDELPDAILISGDVYDKAVPSAEAVQVLDDFLCTLSSRNAKIFIISGNHDSVERLSFCASIMDKSGVHISGVYNGTTDKNVISDEYGNVNIYMLPFIKPADVSRVFPEEEIAGYTDAVNLAVSKMHVDESERNILLTHQFVTGALVCDSEELSVGGTDNVDVWVFSCFDYVALGHIHRPQSAGRETVRYSGTPLKYSFSEANHKKSITVLELFEKGNVKVREIELLPLHDMRNIKGSYMEITSREMYDKSKSEDYVHITLTDEEDIPDAISKLRVFYPNIMKLDYDNMRTRTNCVIDESENIEAKNPLEIFKELYEKQNSTSVNDAQREFLQELIKRVWEEK